MENKFVSPEDLVERLGKKERFYKIPKVDSKNIFADNSIVGLSLPPYDKWVISFMKDLLAGRKLVRLKITLKVLLLFQALKNEDVCIPSVPRYKELSVKTVWRFVKEADDLMLHFPNIDEDELPDCSFMWEILGTLRKYEWKKFVKEARVSRSLDSTKSKEDLIEIHPDFLYALLAIPNLPGRKYESTVD